MTIVGTDLRRRMLRAVSTGEVVCNAERGAWVGPDYKRRMGCYEWADGHHMTFATVYTLIELRNADLIVTVPVVGNKVLTVTTTPLGGATLANWFQGVAL